jgi:uncharacterized membrane protein YkvA (DUF1232 family)
VRQGGYRGSEEEAGAGADEGYVRRRFWPKVRSTLGRVPFLDQAIAAYYAALDPITPPRVKAVLIGALAYFVLPADAIPDIIAALGYTDDAAVLLAVVRIFAPYITDAHRERAEAFLGRTDDGAGADERTPP